MSCVSYLAIGPVTLTAFSTSSWAFDTWGDWFSTPGGEEVELVVAVENATGGFLATPTVQYAEVRTGRPGGRTVLDSSGTATEEKFTATLSVSDKAFARIGIAVKLTSGSIGAGDVYVYVARKSTGEVLGSTVITLNPSEATETRYYPVGGLQPVIGVSPPAGFTSAMWYETGILLQPSAVTAVATVKATTYAKQS